MQTIINLDWLSVSFSLDLKASESEDIYLRCPDTWTFDILSGTNTYKNRVIYRNKYGEKMMTCLYFPKSKLIDKRMALVEIANSLLYSHMWEYVLENLQEIFHEGTITGFSRVDFACDFQFYYDENQVEKPSKYLLKSLENQSFAVLGKRDGASFYSYEHNPNGKIQSNIKQLSFGSKSSQLKWKLYNKTREISEQATNNEDYKKYILDCWAQNGFDMKKDTYRLEVACSNFSTLVIARNQDIKNSIKNLSNSYQEIFKSLYHQGFKVVVNTEESNVSRKPRVNFLNLEDPGFSVTKRPSLSRIPVAEAKKVVSFQLKILQDMGEVARCESAKYLWQSVESLVQEFDLYDWLEWKFEGADLQILWECWLENTGRKPATF